MKMEAPKSTHYLKSLITAEIPMDLERKGEQSYQGRCMSGFWPFQWRSGILIRPFDGFLPEAADSVGEKRSPLTVRTILSCGQALVPKSRDFPLVSGWSAKAD